MTGNGFYADVTGKIGFAPDRTLYYIKGGLALADLSLSVILAVLLLIVSVPLIFPSL